MIKEVVLVRITIAGVMMPIVGIIMRIVVIKIIMLAEGTSPEITPERYIQTPDKRLLSHKVVHSRDDVRPGLVLSFAASVRLRRKKAKGASRRSGTTAPRALRNEPAQYD